MLDYFQKFSMKYQILESTLKQLEKYKNSKFEIIIFSLPGSDKDEWETKPLLSFPLLIPVTTDDDSLLLVEENDIRELSSPINKYKT